MNLDEIKKRAEILKLGEEQKNNQTSTYYWAADTILELVGQIEEYKGLYNAFKDERLRRIKLTTANKIMRDGLNIIGSGEAQFDNVDHMHTARKTLAEADEVMK